MITNPPKVLTGVGGSTPTSGTTDSGFEGPLFGVFGTAASADQWEPLLAEPRSRLQVRAAADRAFWSQVDEPTLAAIRVEASKDLAKPWPQPLASHYARYFRDGNRTEYEGRVRDRQERLSRAAIMAASTLEPRWIDEVVDGVVLLCEQSSWCWAAHDDTQLRHGFVLPEPRTPYLDLGAGEVCGQLAWIDVILGDVLEERAPGIRERIRHETMQRVILPFLERRDWHWLGLHERAHNWNPWIHGNVILAALFLVSDTQLRANVVSLAVEGLDRYAATLPSDGAIDEGYSYWWNGACRLLEALELLRTVTDSALDAFALPMLAETIRFPQRMHLGGPWYVNVADGPARADTARPWHLLHRWGRLLGDADVVNHAAAQRAAGQPVASVAAGLGRALAAMSEATWANATPQAVTQPTSVWLPSVQISVSRPASGTNLGLTLVVKGGHNGEHHNHLDVGSFIVASNGIPCVVDAGQPTYTAQTFGPRRYEIRPMQSRWHNTLSPWGQEQGLGEKYRAENVQLVSGGNGLSLELGHAYDLPEGSSIQRTAELNKDGKITVADQWNLTMPGKPGPHAMELNYLLSGTATLAPGRLHLLPPGAPAVVLTWEPGPLADLETWQLEDPLLEQSWGSTLSRLTLRFPVEARERQQGKLTMTISVEEES